MQKYGTDNALGGITSDRMSVYLARGRSERSKAFHDVLKGMRGWFAGR